MKRKDKSPTLEQALLPYQRKWVNDASNFKAWLKSRQIGGDFSSAFEGVRDIALGELRRQPVTWIISSPSERQSLIAFDHWARWVEAFSVALADVQEDREGKSENVLKSKTAVFPNGSQIIAVPGKPETVRGFSGNVLVTEFAFVEQQDALMRALLPIVSSRFGGPPKKLRLISSANGQGNLFHAIVAPEAQAGESREKLVERIPVHIRERIDAAVARAPKGLKGIRLEDAQLQWSVHRTDIYQAITDGLPVNAYELAAMLSADPEGWAQEFENSFVDQASCLLPYEVLALIESVNATEACPLEFWSAATHPHPIDLGIDFGRSKNLTACVALEMVGDTQITKEVFTMQNVSTPDQAAALRGRIKKARRVALDYTGPGVGLGDLLAREFGEWNPPKNQYGKIELVTFSAPIKVELFGKLAMAAQARKLFIPISRRIREDLHSVYRVVTTSGNVTYRAPQTPDGHADIATAYALAVRAGSVAPSPFFATVC